MTVPSYCESADNVPMKILEEMLVSLCNRMHDFNNTQGSLIGDIGGIKNRLGATDCPTKDERIGSDTVPIESRGLRARIEEACALFDVIEVNSKVMHRELGDIIDIV